MKRFVSNPRNPIRIAGAILIATAVPVFLGAPFFVYVLGMIIGGVAYRKMNEYNERPGGYGESRRPGPPF